jgi:hypothetical protein
LLTRTTCYYKREHIFESMWYTKIGLKEKKLYVILTTGHQLAQRLVQCCCLHLMAPQKSRALMMVIGTEPKPNIVSISVPDLKLQTDCTPHEPAQRQNSSSKRTPMHKWRLCLCLVHKDSPYEPGDCKTSRKVTLCSRVRIGGCNGLESEPRNTGLDAI